MRKSLLLLAAFFFIASMGWALTLPQTGQTTCYNDAGTAIIPCVGTGQDGEQLRGLPWPSTRFVINQNTLTDSLTGLMWLQDANCISNFYPSFDTFGTAGDGKVDWNNALLFVDGINVGTYSACGATFTDWVLPNINELKSLANYEDFDQAPWLTGHGFVNLQPSYWSSTQRPSESAWTFTLGNTMFQQGTGLSAVLPVRVATPGALTLARTGISGSVLPGDDGDTRRGEVPPVPRFTDNLDGTVSDNLTSLMWLKNINCIGLTSYYSYPYPDSPQVTIANFNSVVFSACGVTDIYSDWRVPNVIELESLLDYSSGTPKVPVNDIFVGAFSAYAANTRMPMSDQLFVVDLATGLHSTAAYAPIMAVRGGDLSAEIEATPLALDFGSVEQARPSVAQNVTLTNNGNINLTLSGITSIDSSAFIVDPGTCSDLLLTPTESCTFSISIVTITLGIKNSTVDIASNATAIPLLSVALSGTIVPAIPDNEAPITTPSELAGVYAGPISVALTCADALSGCASIRYTVDGSLPTMASPLYIAPVAMSTMTTLQFFATDVDGNSEIPQSVTYSFVDSGNCPTLVALGDQYGPDINDLNEVVWSAYDAVTGKDQIFSKAGGKLTDVSVGAHSPNINNAGGMAWVEGTGKILRALTVGSLPTTVAYGDSPVILNSGDVYYLENNEVFSLLLGQQTSTGSLKYSLDVNNNGDMVWVEFDGVVEKLFYLPKGGSLPEEIASSPDLLDFPTINTHREIVWSQEFDGIVHIISSQRGDLTINGCIGFGDYWEPAMDSNGALVFSFFDLNGTAVTGLYRLGVAPGGPVATFSFASVENPGAASLGHCDTISFDASLSQPGNAALTSWSWDFNLDGFVDSFGETTSWVFPGAGQYPVTLRVEDSAQQTMTATYNLLLVDSPPVSVISGGPLTIFVGDSLNLDGSTSYDPDFCDPISSYQWDLNNDGHADASGQTLSYLFADLELLGWGPGVHAVSLTVANNSGQVTTSLEVTVAELTPVAPSALFAVAPLPTEVVLAWTDNAVNENSVQIQRATDADFITDLITVAIINGVDPTTYTDGTVTSGTSYYYRVRSGNGTWSTFSNIATVTTPLPPLAITTSSLASGAVGLAYNQTLVANHGTAPYTWSSFGLPRGLTLDPATGIISGTPLTVNVRSGSAYATFPVSLINVDSSVPPVSVGRVLFLRVDP